MKFLIALLFPVTVFAQTIVVTDIDDTLKMSHINSWVDKLTEAHKVDNAFALMPELLQAIDAKIFYVSNAPETLMGSYHRQFLLVNKFPEGELHMRPDVWAKADKLPVIREILNREKPKTVICFGDNGEQDSATYAQLVTEFPDIQFVIFIRWDYSPFVFPEGQTPFVAPGEVALDLNALGMIPDDSVLGLVQAGAMDLKLPPWVDCKTHNPKFLVRPEWLVQADRLSMAIQDRCR